MTGRQDFYLWRLVATGTSFTLFGLGGVILGNIIFPLVSLFSPSVEVEVRRCRRLVQLSFRAFIWFMKTCGILTWEISGREKLTPSGQLIVANHPSLIDIVFLIAMIPNATCIVKPELYRNPFTRGPVRRAGYVPNDAPEELVDNCVQALSSGASLVVFPEGTRSEQGSLRRFRRGAAYVQLRASCPVALAFISAAPPMLGKHEKWYQIPARRSHFRLVVAHDEQSSSKALYDTDAISSRALTQRWRDYFKNEVVI